ncbi:MAG: FAD-dependent oxidoreductase [Gammaproteobacteria bacterium]
MKNPNHSRRNFLKGAAVAGGAVAGAAALAVPLARDEIIDAPYPNLPENKVELPPNGKTVVIVGGGLAGLQAGVELSARGFKVTILERSGTPGGKLKSWRDKTFGPADDPLKQDPSFPGYIREHGLHAVWGFYNNMREFFGRYGWPLMEHPNEVSLYNFLDKDGTVSHLPNTTWPAPYNQLQMALFARKMQHLPEEQRSQFVRLFLKLATFDYADQKQREFLDSLSLAEYCERLGLAKELTYKICDSIVEMAYFDNVDQVSALTLANLFQLVSGSGEDWKVNLYRNAVGETFLQPMVDYIRAHGGEIVYNADVTRIEKDGERISKVVADAVMAGEKKVRRCSVCGNLILDGMERDGDCPFCGANGDMIQVLEDHERTEREFPGDYFVCALDIPAAHKFIGDNIATLGDTDYFRNILKMQPKAVYVCNLWFEGKGAWEKSVKDSFGKPGLCFFATGFDQLGITINKSIRFKGGDGTQWAWSSEYPDRDVTVIETQIAKAERVAGKSKAEITDLCYQELKQVIPDLPPPVSSYVNRWHHYNGYKVGTEKYRPAVQSPIDNLLFIGDLPFVPHPAVFMEKTNVTAKWATNLLLKKAGIAEGQIRILVSGTPSFTVDLMKMRDSVFL